MVYNPATDFLGLWRNNGANVSKLEMPGVDFVVAALARAGLFTLSVSATAPIANQSTTAWLQTAVPSYSAEGTLHLWDPVAAAYAPASAKLLFDLLEASAGQSGISWWTCTGGAPANTVGNNGDLAIREDEPGGVYGPKAAGAWPATPLPGTADVLTSSELDGLFGVQPGQMIYRALTQWAGLLPGTQDQIMTTLNGMPAWDNLSALFDAVLGATQGNILYRGATVWQSLVPSTSTYVLQTNGPGANPSWAQRTPEFLSGTSMIFQQSAAPTGWTKQTTLNDYGLRVVSGAVGTTTGAAFSTVFAQTSVGNTTITTATMPSHNHTTPASYMNTGGGGFGLGTGTSLATTVNTNVTINSNGSDGAHSHSVTLNLAYVDVIIATKN
ncbi:MAG: hypothetical protein AAGL98_00110 [Planctomycetota bacterium]